MAYTYFISGSFGYISGNAPDVIEALGFKEKIPPHKVISVFPSGSQMIAVFYLAGRGTL